MNSAIQLIIYERDLSIVPQQSMQISHPTSRKTEDALQGTGHGVKRKWSPAWATQSLTSQVNKHRHQTSSGSTALQRNAIDEMPLHISSRNSTPPSPVVGLDHMTSPVTQVHPALKLSLARSTARQVQPSTASMPAPALWGAYAGTATEADQSGGRTLFGRASHDPLQQANKGVFGHHTAASLPAASTWQSGSVPEVSLPQTSVNLTQGRAFRAAPPHPQTRYAPMQADILPQHPQPQQLTNTLFSLTRKRQAAISREVKSSCNLHTASICDKGIPDHPNRCPGLVSNNISQYTTGSPRQQDTQSHYEQQQQQLQQQQELQQSLQQQLQQQQALQLQSLKQQLQDLQTLQQVTKTPSSLESGCVEESKVSQVR